MGVSNIVPSISTKTAGHAPAFYGTCPARKREIQYGERRTNGKARASLTPIGRDNATIFTSREQVLFVRPFSTTSLSLGCTGAPTARGSR